MPRKGREPNRREVVAAEQSHEQEVSRSAGSRRLNVSETYSRSKKK